ncbi:hypothetical protein HK100_010347 [Physocladia obscura]|uniref:UspA domain-containing protein n=1 Tax=Physocladia obscura TaxID=109957 RepID=A0AAD5XDU9_9FUNG|nr:hypothetical protein HK100_010347 [Physocladia obscura]
MGETKGVPIESVTDVVISANVGTFKTTRTVVIAVDGSKFSEYAVNSAIDDILQPSEFVIIISVVDKSFAELQTATSPEATLQQKQPDAVEHDNTSILRKYYKLVARKGFQCKAVSVVGIVKEAIVLFVNNVNADLLIVGSRGKDLASKSLIGSRKADTIQAYYLFYNGENGGGPNGGMGGIVTAMISLNANKNFLAHNSTLAANASFPSGTLCGADTSTCMVGSPTGWQIPQVSFILCKPV